MSPASVAAYRTIERIRAVTTKLAAHRGNEKAIWEHLPVAFAEVFGRPLDREDAHDIMLCQQVVRTLTG